MNREELKKLGFESDGVIQDLIYEDYHLSVNDSYINYCFQHLDDGEINRPLVTINDRQLKGRLPTQSDIEYLKQIL